MPGQMVEEAVDHEERWEREEEALHEPEEMVSAHGADPTLVDVEKPLVPPVSV